MMWLNCDRPSRAGHDFTKNYAPACLVGRDLGNRKKSERADDHLLCPCDRAGQPAARLAAAVGRRRHLYADAAGRESFADGSRHDVADHRRAVDPRPSRGAGNRRLFLHHARPALDLDAMAGAGDVCEGLYARRLERPGGGGGQRDRGDVCAIDQTPQPPSHRQHDIGVCRRGAGVDGRASAGAAARAGDAHYGDVGRRLDGRRGSARRAIFLAAAVDGVMGQSAWRLCVRSGVDRADRARCGGRRRCERRANRWCCAGRCSACWRWWQAAARPMAGTRCWRRKRSSSSAARCR